MEDELQLPDDPTRRFALLKSIAHFEGAWRECESRECRSRKRCCGGPRGTMASTGGHPLCRPREQGPGK